MRRIAVLALLLTISCGRHRQPVASTPTVRPTDASTAALPQPAPTITTEAVDAGPDVVQPVALENPTLACGSTKGLRVGMAVLEATVTVEGTVDNVRVIRSLSPDTDAALLACVAKWRYKPATYKGKPVSIKLTIAVNLCA